MKNFQYQQNEKKAIPVYFHTKCNDIRMILVMVVMMVIMMILIMRMVVMRKRGKLQQLIRMMKVLPYIKIIHVT